SGVTRTRLAEFASELIDHLLQALGARIDVAVIEDRVEHLAAPQRRRLLPSLARFGILVEGARDHGRKFALRLDGLERLLGDLFGPFLARSRALLAHDLVDHPAFARIAPLVEELAQRLFLLEKHFEFDG